MKAIKWILVLASVLMLMGCVKTAKDALLDGFNDYPSESYDETRDESRELDAVDEAIRKLIRDRKFMEMKRLEISPPSSVIEFGNPADVMVK